MNEQSRETCILHEENLTCTSVTSQYADVSVPLKLKPYACVGRLVTECCGEPVIALRPCTVGSCGCELLITQTVCIRIPLEYGANADIGDLSTSCKQGSNCPDSGRW